MDELDRLLINTLQEGLPLVDRPFRAVGERLGLSEAEILARLEKLLSEGTLTRFGPMYHAERMGGSLVLAAMAVPEERFDEVAALVNGFVEVAHNYRREHALNMWFVVGTETPEQAREALAAIAARTGLPVYPMPKEREYFIGLRFEA